MGAPGDAGNLSLLRARGVTIIAPTTGALATRNEWGTGRLADVADLVAAFEAVGPRGRRARGTACAS